jgi:putative transposase
VKRLKRQRRFRKRYNTIWEVADEMWTKIEAALPPGKPVGSVGRPALSNRRVYDGVVYVLRTGCQWKSLKTSWFGAASSIHARFQSWREQGVWLRVFRMMLRYYNRMRRIQWNWQALDSKSVAAPLGGDKTGKNPTDRGKCGSKRHVLVDGRGAPLSITISAANTHDSRCAIATLEALPVEKPKKVKRVHHLCADKAYDAASIRRQAHSLGYQVHIPRRKAQPKVPKLKRHPSRRWVVEPTLSWQNNFRSLRTRWLKKRIQLASLQPACFKPHHLSYGILRMNS